MSKYRKTSLGMWADEKFRRLSKPKPNGQSLWQWLITGPRTTQIPGIVLGTPEELAAALRWPLDRHPGSLEPAFRDAFAEVLREGMAKADSEAGLVWLPKAPEHNKPESPNGVRSWRTAWDDVPECALKGEAWRALKGFTEGWGVSFAKAFADACRQPSAIQEQEQEQEQEQDTNAPAERAPVQPVLISVPALPRFDFAAVYARYPRKKGKHAGLDSCAKLIRTAGDYEALRRGVDAFAAEQKRLGTPLDKIPYWSTFVNERRWEDFADEPPRRLSLEEREDAKDRAARGIP